MTEKQLQRAVLDWLNHVSKTRPIYFFRSAAGAVKTQHGRFFKTGKPGCPDISLVLGPGGPMQNPECPMQGSGGLYIGLEIKSGTGRQSAAQKAAQGQIEAAGGVYKIIRCMDDLKEILNVY